MSQTWVCRWSKFTLINSWIDGFPFPYRICQTPWMLQRSLINWVFISFAIVAGTSKLPVPPVVTDYTKDSIGSRMNSRRERINGYFAIFFLVLAVFWFNLSENSPCNAKRSTFSHEKWNKVECEVLMDGEKMIDVHIYTFIHIYISGGTHMYSFIDQHSMGIAC